MTEIRQLAHVTSDDLARIITSYVSDAAYTVRKSETPERTTITVELVTLETPRRKRYHAMDAETQARYQGVLAQGLSFGAYDGDTLVGLAIAERHDWNNSLWVWEFHVAELHRGQGIGRRLMEALVGAAHTANVRIIVCETQSANVPAIRFYRRMGFELDGVDMSYYSNTDVEHGEVAVFMKRKLL
jgi:ribosomal protein S18 acetylase RimI-like enzyme